MMENLAMEEEVGIVDNVKEETPASNTTLTKDGMQMKEGELEEEKKETEKENEGEIDATVESAGPQTGYAAPPVVKLGPSASSTEEETSTGGDDVVVDEPTAVPTTEVKEETDSAGAVVIEVNVPTSTPAIENQEQEDKAAEQVVHETVDDGGTNPSPGDNDTINAPDTSTSPEEPVVVEEEAVVPAPSTAEKATDPSVPIDDDKPLQEKDSLSQEEEETKEKAVPDMEPPKDEKNNSVPETDQTHSISPNITANSTIDTITRHTETVMEEMEDSMRIADNLMQASESGKLSLKEQKQEQEEGVTVSKEVDYPPQKEVERHGAVEVEWLENSSKEESALKIIEDTAVDDPGPEVLEAEDAEEHDESVEVSLDKSDESSTRSTLEKELSTDAIEDTAINAGPEANAEDQAADFAEVTEITESGTIELSRVSSNNNNSEVKLQVSEPKQEDTSVGQDQIQGNSEVAEESVETDLEGWMAKSIETPKPNPMEAEQADEVAKPVAAEESVPIDLEQEMNRFLTFTPSPVGTEDADELENQAEAEEPVETALDSNLEESVETTTPIPANTEQADDSANPFDSDGKDNSEEAEPDDKTGDPIETPTPTPVEAEPAEKLANPSDSDPEEVQENSEVVAEPVEAELDDGMAKSVETPKPSRVEVQPADVLAKSIDSVRGEVQDESEAAEPSVEAEFDNKMDESIETPTPNPVEAFPADSEVTEKSVEAELDDEIVESTETPKPRVEADPADADSGHDEVQDKSDVAEESAEAELDDKMAKSIETPTPNPLESALADEMVKPLDSPDGPEDENVDNAASGLSVKEREDMLKVAARKSTHQPAAPVVPKVSMDGSGSVVKEREKMLLADARRNLKPEGPTAQEATATPEIGKGVKEREAMLLADARKNKKEMPAAETVTVNGMTIHEREEMLREAARSRSFNVVSSDSTELATVAPKNVVKEREEMLKASLKKDCIEEKLRAREMGMVESETPKNTVKEREEMLKASLKKDCIEEKLRARETGMVESETPKNSVKEREEMLKASLKNDCIEEKLRAKATAIAESETPKNSVKEREEMLKASLKRDSTPGRRASESMVGATAKIETLKNTVKEREEMLRAALKRDRSGPPQGRRASDSKLGDTPELDRRQSVKDQIAAINGRAKQSPLRRSSTGEITTSRTALSPLPPRPSPSVDSTNLLKTYNPDLYYANQFNRLVDLDPADVSNSDGIDFEQVMKIVEAYPDVCKAKYDLTFDGQKLKLHPLFSLVANKAPVMVVKAVFMENPFRLLDVRDEKGMTLLHYACAYNPLPMESLEYLEKRSSHTLDAWDNQKRSPLHFACEKMTPAIVLFILEHSSVEIAASPDSEGNLPIDLALKNPLCTEEVKEALRNKANGFVAVAPKAPPPKPVNSTEPNSTQVDTNNNNNNNNNPAEAVSSSPTYKTTTEMVGPQTWWERFCCVPKI